MAAMPIKVMKRRLEELGANPCRLATYLEKVRRWMTAVPCCLLLLFAAVVLLLVLPLFVGGGGGGGGVKRRYPGSRQMRALCWDAGCRIKGRR